MLNCCLVKMFFIFYGLLLGFVGIVFSIFIILLPFILVGGILYGIYCFFYWLFVGSKLSCVCVNCRRCFKCDKDDKYGRESNICCIKDEKDKKDKKE